MTRTWLAAFASLQLADVLTTQHVLAHGGWEGNPATAWMIEAGVWLPIKVTFTLACLLVMSRKQSRVFAALTVLLGVVVVNNLVQVW